MLSASVAITLRALAWHPAVFIVVNIYLVERTYTLLLYFGGNTLAHSLWEPHFYTLHLHYMYNNVHI